MGSVSCAGWPADEFPSLGLTRLTAALRSDDPAGRYLSVVGQPAAMTQHDRAALSAAALALVHEVVDQHPAVLFDERLTAGGRRPRFAVALHIPPHTGADHLQRRLGELIGSRQVAVHVTDGCLIGVVAAGPPPQAQLQPHSCRGRRGAPLQDWERHELVRGWHAQLSSEFGPISLGYSAVHIGPAGLRQAVLHARQALIAGTRVMGEGQACAHGDVALRSFLARTGLHGLHETLLGPLIAHDRVEQVKLLPTLDIYLDSACVTKQTAERLHIHRNSVVYRLRRIESVAQVDLSDADTRLLLQLALRATRVLNLPAPYSGVRTSSAQSLMA